MSAYLDASVVLPTLIAEPTTEAVYDCLGTGDRELLISDFAAAEVAAALSRLVRMALLTNADASARLADFDAWRETMSSPVDIREADVRLAYIYVRRFDLGLRAPDAFGGYLALGITVLIATQTLVNLGVVTGLLPTKGLPLPFISFGGSALLMTMLSTGVLLNISQQAHV